MTTSRQHTLESLQKLNERLAVIDHAQKNITDLAANMSSLHSVLANKQQRGAFGQGRLEIIVQDGLPRDCYEFQFTLSNKSRPDCAVFLPDGRPLAIDAKFPLEAVTALREAKSDDERKQAAARLRQDFARHLGDVPVCVWSSSQSRRDEALLKEMGVSRFITKPSGLDQFMKIGKTIKDLLEASKAA